MTFRDCAERCGYTPGRDDPVLFHLQGLYTDAIVAWLVRQEGIQT